MVQRPLLLPGRGDGEVEKGGASKNVDLEDEVKVKVVNSDGEGKKKEAAFAETNL